MIMLVVVGFKSLPIGSGSLNTVDFRELALWLGIMFQVALSMSLSGIIALLTINLSFGVMTRAAPQLNIFSLGFAFALIVGLLLCWYIISGLAATMSYSGYKESSKYVALFAWIARGAKLAGNQTVKNVPKRPRPSDLQQAREKGQMARSKELASVSVLVVGAIALMWFGDWLSRSLYTLMGKIIQPLPRRRSLT